MLRYCFYIVFIWEFTWHIPVTGYSPHIHAPLVYELLLQVIEGVLKNDFALLSWPSVSLCSLAGKSGPLNLP